MSHEYSRDTATPRLRAALDRRMLLIILQAIDGWSVQLARAVLARAQGATKCPFIDSCKDLLKRCRATLFPSVPTLVSRAKQHGVVLRRDMTRALAQCASHHRLLPKLAEEYNASRRIDAVVDDAIALRRRARSARVRRRAPHARRQRLQDQRARLHRATPRRHSRRRRRCCEADRRGAAPVGSA